MSIDLSWEGQAADIQSATEAMDRLLDEARILGLMSYRVRWENHGDVLVASSASGPDRTEPRDISMLGIEVEIRERSLCIGYSSAQVPLPMMWARGDICCAHEVSEAGWQSDCAYCRSLDPARPPGPPALIEGGYYIRTTRIGASGHVLACDLLDVLRQTEGIELEVCDDTAYWDHRDFQRLEAAFDQDAQAVAMIAPLAAEAGGTFIGAGGLVSADEDGALDYLTSQTVTGGLGWKNPPGWVSVPA